jgi:hypothetical protein
MNNRSRVAGWQHRSRHERLCRPSKAATLRKTVGCFATSAIELGRAGGAVCSMFARLLRRSKAKRSKAATGGTGQDDIFWPLYFHGAHNAPVAAAPVMTCMHACMHAYNIGQALIVLSTAMIRNCKIRMKEESFRQSTILYEREVFVDCWIVNALHASEAMLMAGTAMMSLLSHTSFTLLD